MNKVISTEDRIFMSVVGASGSGKTQLILALLSETVLSCGIFYPNFLNIIYYYKFWQPIYEEFQKRLEKKISFIRISGEVSELDDTIQELLERSFTVNNKPQKLLTIFDDSCDEVLQCKNFALLATAGRHKGIHVIFIKHNLYQQGRFSVTIDKSTTHILLLKTPRIGKQLQILGGELEYAGRDFLTSCYQQATSKPYGHLLIDLSTRCDEALRISTNICKNVWTVETRGNNTPLKNNISALDCNYTIFFVSEAIQQNVSAFSTKRHRLITSPEQETFSKSFFVNDTSYDAVFKLITNSV